MVLHSVTSTGRPSSRARRPTRRGAGRGRRARCQVAGEVGLVIPGGGADRGRLDRVEDGKVAVVDAARHPLAGVLGSVAVEDPAGGCLARAAAEFSGLGGGRQRQPRSAAGPLAGSAGPGSGLTAQSDIRTA